MSRIGYVLWLAEVFQSSLVKSAEEQNYSLRYACMRARLVPPPPINTQSFSQTELQSSYYICKHSLALRVAVKAWVRFNSNQRISAERFIYAAEEKRWGRFGLS